MIQQNELITFLVGLGVALYLISNRRRMSRLPCPTCLYVAYLALFTGWSLTIVEGFLYADLFNLLEHLAYAVSSVAAATWCWKVFIRGERVR